MSSIAKGFQSPLFYCFRRVFVAGRIVRFASYPYEEARRAALMAVDVLQGKKPENKIVKNSKPNLIFDYKQLDFFNMDKDDVPRGSIIINEPLGKYQPLFLLFYSALCCHMVLAIVALFRANRREFKRRYYANKVVAAKANGGSAQWVR